MFSHQQVWSAIDALAARHGISVSKLARNAGLDPTTFNKSKRAVNDGRLRWPSTESLAKIMQSTGTSMEEFIFYLSPDKTIDGDRLPVPEASGASGFFDREASGYSSETLPGSLSKGPENAFAVPLLGLAQAGAGGFFDDAGLPTGEGWDAVDFPFAGDETVYALEISGDSMLPLYRDGDRIIISPTQSVRRGDRVVVRTTDGEVMAKILARQTARTIDLHSLNPEHEPRQFDPREIDWMARIIWASQ